MWEKWTEKETQFLIENLGKMTNGEISDSLRRTTSSISNRMTELKKSGFKRRTNKRMKFKRVPCIYPELGDCKVSISRSKCYGGYIRIQRNGRRYRLHRYVWELYHGPIPDGLSVLHKCDNPPCYEITHLFLGTNKDNMEDAAKKGRMNKNRPLNHKGSRYNVQRRQRTWFCVSSTFSLR